MEKLFRDSHIGNTVADISLFESLQPASNVFPVWNWNDNDPPFKKLDNRGNGYNDDEAIYKGSTRPNTNSFYLY